MKKLLALVVALAFGNAFAAVPENGWWWNPAKSGTGYNIESQNNTVFVATFIYDEAGHPVWYSGSGRLNTNDVVTLKLMHSEGGSCLGCAYTPATAMDSGHLLTLTFDTESTATVNLDGVTSQIERFNFNYGSGAQRLIGIWAIVLAAPPDMGLGMSDTIGFASASGDNAIGFRMSDTSVPVVAKFQESGKTKTYLAFTPISTNQDLVIFFIFRGLNQIGGLAAVVNANASADEISNAITGDSHILTHGFRHLPPPINTAQTASTKQVPNSGDHQADIQPMLEKLDEVAALIKEEGFTLELPEVWNQ